MDTLLNQLKEQDLELYQEIVADLLPSRDHRNNFIICGKLQEAIRARGWYLTQWTQSDPIFPEIECVIHCPIKKEVPSGYKGSLFNDYFGRGDTEAEALCRAYLEAIEAVKG